MKAEPVFRGPNATPRTGLATIATMTHAPSAAPPSARLLPLCLADERAADVQGHCAVAERVGEALRSMIVVTDIKDRTQLRLRQAWWEAHYWGRPDRESERTLALMRAAVTLDERQGVAVVRRWLDR